MIGVVCSIAIYYYIIFIICVKLQNSKDKSVVIQSGSVVELVEMKTKESVTRKLEMLCSPEWKKIEQNGGDVVGKER